MGYTKIVQSGNFLEIYEFEKSLPQRRNNIRIRVKSRPNPDRRRRADNVRRLRGRFIRLIRSNLVGETPPVFLTLTMREVVSVKNAFRSFSRFSCALRLKYGRGIKYIAVPEFQKRDAVHFHALVWGFSDETINTERQTRTLAKLWREGFIDLIKTDGNIKLAYYFGKYMSKTLFDPRLKAQKAYVASRNVMRPVSLSDSMAYRLIDEIWGIGDNSVADVERSYDTMWLGRCIYKAYNLLPHENSNNINKANSR